MEYSKNAIKLARARIDSPDAREYTETHAVGGGEWSLEVHDSENGFICEYVGSNGTRDDDHADLHGEYREDSDAAQEIIKKGILEKIESAA